MRRASWADWRRLRRRSLFVLLIAMAVLAADSSILAAWNSSERPQVAVRLVHRDLDASMDPGAIVKRADEARNAAITALLARRGKAVLARDEQAFLADVDPSDPAFYAAQRALFSSLMAVPFSSIDFVLNGDRAVGRPNPARYAGAPTWIPDVTMEYKIAGFDPTNATERQVDTFVYRGSRWLLASNSDLAALGHPSDHELWDYGQVVVVTGPDCLVIGFAGEEPLMRALAAEIDRDIPKVSAVWGEDWPQRAVLEVPATQQQFAAVSGVSGDLSEVEAVQSTEVSGDGGAQQQSGNRITVNPAAFRQLNDAGRSIVLTHELAHVASRAATRPVTPLWLIEGFADYVAFRNSQLSTSAITIELRERVRASGLPTALPPDSAFDSADPNVASSYEEGWLACRLIAAKYGTAQLVHFYQLVGQSHDSATAVDAALRAVTGQSIAAFTAQWRNYVAEQVQ